MNRIWVGLFEIFESFNQKPKSHMSKVKQNPNGKGSLKDIQLLINEHPEILNALLKSKISELKSEKIEWLSPLKSDDFAEYRDDDFIKLLDLKLSKPLTDFWPKRGPQWDALGKCNDIVFLIEAKANIPEIASPGTKAKTESKKKIDASLKWTKNELGIIKEVDWSSKFYQYTNRLAHLCFLRSQNIPAYLGSAEKLTRHLLFEPAEN